MRYVPFSKKQLKLLTWWTDESPYKNASGIVADGSVRAGKTIVMALSYVIWATSKGTGLNYAITSKTVSSCKRNVITPLIAMLRLRGYKVINKKTEGMLIIKHKGNVNYFYIFGGKDESSASLIQGLTLAGVLFDEVALMPRSFVEQALARCSIEGAKYWFNCNPEGPMHWFKTEHIDKARERNYLLLHFYLDDNPSLSEAIKNKYKTMFTGLFYKRFILGEWAFSDGVIYSSIHESSYYDNSNRKEILPIAIQENDIKPIISADYGTNNPMVYLKVYKVKKPDSKIPYFFVDDEYYWNSKSKFKQKTDAEYVEDFKAFISDTNYKVLIIDPSASSLIVAHKKQNQKVRQAKNNVREGISMLATLFHIGHIKINKENCPNLISELGLYQWNDKKALIGIEEPMKVNDHACDALRYAIFTTTVKHEVFGGEFK